MFAQEELGAHVARAQMCWEPALEPLQEWLTLVSTELLFSPVLVFIDVICDFFFLERTGTNFFFLFCVT